MKRKNKFKLLGIGLFFSGTWLVGMINNLITNGEYAHWFSIYLMLGVWSLSGITFLWEKSK